ncbi:hypothetical protein [Streptomyces antimicrobicus]|uniref:Bulb-type lectin domain-containing protein n=1 Tax=Streptomyces antimicrobicus TaxID=2883108 RepID=A0ABS8B2D7_9ACTN|nr:hypothetical protein [Streptomyces antimicrobicus]MCB5178760.1 hypothetical protein [Streptomyces antimicrobicus]
MHARALRRALVTLLAATAAATALVPTTATPAAAAGPGQCRGPRGGILAEISPGQRLEPGGRLADKVSRTELVMQTDGNLVLYALGNPGGHNLPLWHSGTWGNPGAYATMQADGNFVVYKQGGGPQTGGGIWHTGTYGTGTTFQPKAYLLEGEFVVEGRGTRGADSQRWSSRTTEQLNQLCSDYETAAHGWSTGSWAQSATVWLVLQQDNNLVMYRKSDGKAIWHSGTYGGSQRVTLQMLYADRGDLTIRNASLNNTGAVRWRTSTGGNADAWALLQDDGNFVVYKRDGGPGKGGALWHTATYNKI